VSVTGTIRAALIGFARAGQVGLAPRPRVWSPGIGTRSSSCRVTLARDALTDPLEKLPDKFSPIVCLT
jgi:hypothetical protein